MFKRIVLFLLTNLAVIALLSIVMFLLESYLGFPLTGYTYLFVFALVIGFGGAFISLALSRGMAKTVYNIQLIKEENIDQLNKKERVVWTIVQDLAERHRIKMPEVGIYHDAEPNAFATGPSKNSSLVAVSTGLLDVMEVDAIEGVVGHEMAHVLNGDMVTMTLLQGVLNTFVIFFARTVANIISNFLDERLSSLAYYLITLILEILFGLLASIILMAFSRHREYRADAGSAEFVGKQKMIAGLEALRRLQDISSSETSKFATMKISGKKKGGFLSLFSSHPDLEDRIEKLKEMSL